MLARVAHRGPDDTGVQVVGNTWLGHQRLSIMDVSGGHQPMSDVARTAWIVGNGEIYNHERIAKAFPDGTVRTKSDTEAALHAVMWDGQAAVASLNGMFAVAMGRTDGAGLVARDPFGVKPLYWVPPTETGGDDVPYTAPDPSETVLFASELRAFDPEDRPYVRSFPPGCLWSPSSGLVRFADAVPVEVRPARRAIRPGWDDADLSRVREAVVSAVRRRMMRPGPRRAAATFAVGTAESGDLIAARKVAAHIGSDHHEILVTPEDLHEALDHAVEVIEHYDPALVRSAVPNLILAREAAKKVKVVLTGEGADELFAGYSYVHGPEYADPDTLQAELVRSLEQLHHLNLQRCDRTTMYFGLEAREPFLDSGLVRAALALPPEWKQRPDGRPEKAILREAFAGWLPESVLWRGKEQFGDGSGAGTVLAELASRKAAAAADAGVTDGVPEHRPTPGRCAARRRSCTTGSGAPTSTGSGRTTCSGRSRRPEPQVGPGSAPGRPVGAGRVGELLQAGGVVAVAPAVRVPQPGRGQRTAAVHVGVVHVDQQRQRRWPVGRRALGVGVGRPPQRQHPGVPGDPGPAVHAQHVGRARHAERQADAVACEQVAHAVDAAVARSLRDGQAATAEDQRRRGDEPGGDLVHPVGGLVRDQRVRLRDDGAQLLLGPDPGTVGRTGARCGERVVPAGRDDHRGARDRVGHHPRLHPEHPAHQVGGHRRRGRALRDDRAVGHRDQVVGVAAGQVQVVQDDDDRAAPHPVPVDEQVQHLDRVRQVQERGRLVEQQRPGVLGQHHRDPHALALTAGQLVDRPVGQLQHPGRAHRVGDGGVVADAAAAEPALVRRPAAFHQVGDGDAVRGGRGLGEQPEPPGQLAAGQRPDVGAVETHGPGGRGDDPAQPPQQRGLAAGVRTDDHGDPAGRDVHGQAVDDDALVVAQDQPQQVGGADRAGDDACGQRDLGDQGAGDDVGEQHQCGPDPGGVRQRRPPGAGEPRGERPADERDERDRPGRGDRCGDQQDGHRQQRGPGPADGQAERGRGVVAELQAGQRAGQQQPGRDEHGAGERQRDRGGPAGLGDAAGQPDQRLLRRGQRRGDHQVGHDGHRRRPDPDPDQHEAGAAEAVAAGQDGDEQRRRDGAEDRAGRGPGGGQAEHDRGGDRTDGRTGTHADHVRAGQGVAQHPLEQRPGQAERRPDQQRGQRPRHPQPQHHQLGARRAEPGERGQHVAGTEALRTDREGGDERGERGRGDGEPGRRAPAPGSGPDPAQHRGGVVAGGRGGRHRRNLRRRTSATNSGAPTTAVTTPAWTSPGGVTTRPRTSAASSRTGPASAASGSTTRWSVPARRRTRCGTASPRKAIGPAAAVAAPASTTRATPHTARSVPTARPNDRATSSPSASALSRGPQVRASASPATTNGAACAAIPRSRPRRARRPPGPAWRGRRCRAGRSRPPPRRRRPPPPPGEAEPDVAGEGVDAEQRDPEHDGERGAGVEPEDAGLGDRVARHALCEHPGHAERGPGEDRQHRARQPHLGDDERVRRGPVDGAGARRPARPRRATAGAGPSPVRPAGSGRRRWSPGRSPRLRRRVRERGHGAVEGVAPAVDRGAGERLGDVAVRQQHTATGGDRRHGLPQRVVRDGRGVLRDRLHDGDVGVEEIHPLPRDRDGEAVGALRRDLRGVDHAQLLEERQAPGVTGVGGVLAEGVAGPGHDGGALQLRVLCPGVGEALLQVGLRARRLLRLPQGGTDRAELVAPGRLVVLRAGGDADHRDAELGQPVVAVACAGCPGVQDEVRVQRGDGLQVDLERAEDLRRGGVAGLHPRSEAVAADGQPVRGPDRLDAQCQCGLGVAPPEGDDPAGLLGDGDVAERGRDRHRESAVPDGTVPGAGAGAVSRIRPAPSPR
ncbi:hypothetical protein L7F22_015006 [Adiantum nelumboides]|nr:hypothetical protein [Adiantum nelumboides]